MADRVLNYRWHSGAAMIAEPFIVDASSLHSCFADLLPLQQDPCSASDNSASIQSMNILLCFVLLAAVLADFG